MSEEKAPEQGTTPVAEPDVMQYPLGALGAVIGAALGVLVMRWAVKTNFHWEVIIGILSGLLAGWFARRGSWVVGMIAGVVTLVTSLWAEWKFGWVFKKDDSFGYFMSNLHNLPALLQLMLIAGVLAAVWLGARR